MSSTITKSANAFTERFCDSFTGPASIPEIGNNMLCESSIMYKSDIGLICGASFTDATLIITILVSKLVLPKLSTTLKVNAA